jgi:UDP-N-acetyl-D-mannosaminuronic acid dehydrogenase
MKDKKYDICIVGGLGHIGLPLGISFAAAGKKVILYDINKESLKTVSKGKMPFLETGAEEVLKEVIDKTLFLSHEKSAISNAYFVVVVIGTPVDKHLNPDFTVFIKFFDGILDSINKSQHILLRSTVLPGTTEKIKSYLESKGKNVRLSFCPERIAEGKAMEELHTLPQIISAFDEDSFEEAKELFSCLTNEIVFLNPKEAELAKLFTNVWRYIQFATANQFYQIATQQGLDFYRIYSAIIQNYPRAQNFPAAGLAAGPCLFKDTMQLASFSNNSFFLGHAAMLINEGLPNFIVERLRTRHNLRNKTVGILGMAFKANSDDKRESLSYKLKKILEVEAKKVLCTDVYISEKGFVSANELVKQSDIIILAAPHKEYKGLRIGKSKHLVDMWNFYGSGGQI